MKEENMKEENMKEEDVNEEDVNEERGTLERIADEIADLLDLQEVSGMNDQEFRVMSYLTSAWNHFVEIPNMRNDDREEFLHALHTAQNLIGMSVLRRDRPEFWVKPE